MTFHGYGRIRRCRTASKAVGVASGGRRDSYPNEEVMVHVRLRGGSYTGRS
jgi:hypothetical protein